MISFSFCLQGVWTWHQPQNMSTVQSAGYEACWTINNVNNVILQLNAQKLTGTIVTNLVLQSTFDVNMIERSNTMRSSQFIFSLFENPYVAILLHQLHLQAYFCESIFQLVKFHEGTYNKLVLCYIFASSLNNHIAIKKKKKQRQENVLIHKSQSF